MADKSTDQTVSGDNDPRSACIHTNQIVDSCLDKDCVEDLRVYLTTESQAVLNRSTGAKTRCAELLFADVDVEPLRYKRGYYAIDITFYYRIIGDAFRTYPTLWHHGTSKEMDTEDSFYTSARVMSDVYKYRVACKERRAKGGLLGGDVTVPGEVEWVALTRGDMLCLVMVNTKQTAEKVRVTVPGKQFFAPTYRLVRIKDPKYIDCREVPGEAKLWETFAYEDTQTGPENGGPEVYNDMKAKCDDLFVNIGPNTVQSVEVVMKNAPKSSEK